MANMEYKSFWSSLHQQKLVPFLLFLVMAVSSNIFLWMYYPVINSIACLVGLILSYSLAAITIITSRSKGIDMEVFDTPFNIFITGLAFTIGIGACFAISNLFFVLYYSDYGKLCRYRGYIFSTKKNRMNHTLRILNGELSRDIPKNYE